MNPPPVPFGDPAQSQQQRSAAVRKGVAFGCGGCALLSFLSLSFVAGIVFVVMSVIRNTGPCQMTLAAARSSAVLTQALGEPIKMGWFVAGSVNSENGKTEADVTVPLAGPNGKARVRTVGSRQGASGWHFREMTATIEATGETVDLKPR